MEPPASKDTIPAESNVGTGNRLEADTPDRLGVDEPTFRPFRSLRELPVEPDWIWRGYLAPRALTLLAGHAFAGKSMLVGGLLRALADGGPFLGRETTRTTALLVTEEDDSVLRQRAELLGLLEVGGAYISRSTGVGRHSWPDLVSAATDQAILDGHSLVVFDTFAGLAQLGGEQENDAGAVSERLRPLQTAASMGLAVLVLHHMNGYGQPRGSKAFRGIVDIEIRFHRDKSNAFRLTTDSRYPTSSAAVLHGNLVKGPGLWSYEAKATDASRSHANTDELLRAALADAGAKGLTYEEVDMLPDLSRDKAKRRFPGWLENGRIQCEGSGTKNEPFRWIALPV